MAVPKGKILIHAPYWEEWVKKAYPNYLGVFVDENLSVIEAFRKKLNGEEYNLLCDSLATRAQATALAELSTQIVDKNGNLEDSPP